MKALMLGKIADTILAQIEKLENENKELKETIAQEQAMRIDYTYNDIRKWLLHFRDLDYSKIKNRRDLIDTFIYKVVLYDHKMKVLFHLKGGQKEDLLLNLIFPDYPDGDDADESQTPENEKETDNAVSNCEDNAGCAYTSRVVEVRGLAPLYHRATNEISTCVGCLNWSRLAPHSQNGRADKAKIYRKCAFAGAQTQFSVLLTPLAARTE